MPDKLIGAINKPKTREKSENTAPIKMAGTRTFRQKDWIIWCLSFETIAQPKVIVYRPAFHVICFVLYDIGMIGYLSGNVVYKDERGLILNVAGVGYKVSAPPDTLAKIAVGKDSALWTYLAVREDALDLYGFSTQDELGFFKLLIGISGIGPKTALGILSATTIQTIRRAVKTNDTSYLTKISGIGKKLAEKLVHELKDKIETDNDSEDTPEMKDESDVLEALKSLGYQEREIRDTLKKLPATVVGASNRIKAALKQLGK